MCEDESRRAQHAPTLSSESGVANAPTAPRVKLAFDSTGIITNPLDEQRKRML